MGILRFFLALAVLIGHAHYRRYIPVNILPFVKSAEYAGTAKISSFFLISGFFSDMLINNRLRNKKDYIKDFYLTRISRLLPCYLFILLLSAGLYLLIPYFGFKPIEIKDSSPYFILDNFNTLRLAYVFANLIPFLSEVFRIDFSHQEPMISLVVGQSWTLSIEWACLLIVPFVFRNKKLYISFIVFFTVVSMVLWHFGIFRGYVATTMIFFLLGSVAYRIYNKWVQHWPMTNWLRFTTLTILALLVLYIFHFAYVENLLGSEWTYFIFLSLVFLSLPLLLTGSRTFLKDKMLGDLAYPMYLNHMLMLQLLDYYNCSPVVIAWAAPALSILFACLMVKMLDQPSQRWRQKNFYNPLAETGGFEPPMELPPYTLSKRARSTALPRLR